MNSETSPPENERSEIRLVEAVINLDSWLLQKNLENALTSQYFWKVRYGRLRGNCFARRRFRKRYLDDYRRSWSSIYQYSKIKAKNFATPNLGIN